MKPSSKASARFFLRVGQIKASERKRDEQTLPLFTLPMIMQCEGLLSRQCERLMKRIEA